MPTCHRHYPGRFNGACPLVYLHCQRPSPCNSKVGSCNYCFGACSAFTHVMACTLAESPSDPLHRELRQLCCLRCRLDCYRVERTSSRAGVSPTEVQRLSRRTLTPTIEHGRRAQCRDSRTAGSHPGSYRVVKEQSELAAIVTIRVFMAILPVCPLLRSVKFIEGTISFMPFSPPNPVP